ncbi:MULTISPECIES: hypothetical protein [unclassified Streptomyces]|uniref:hypothetical protein n=1 Tax=unclassified Streptomyces TaxID=2593676 RepID=UPI00224FBD37|nr:MULTISPECIES: hypothetical protein [unclassified Streptomyces]MCX4410236.1 hypothetical protein [Streptomyces sp. NBC_01764]MCX5192014.1 hypothetical protein [Streptomyces sp. NBC_00268]
MNMDAHRKDLYPDVTASGGLGPAMREAAQLRGCDTGLGPWAVDVVSIQTASQWAELLSSDFNRRQWNLLRRLRADEVLRDMFPTISHGAVRLCVDAMDGRSRQVLVDEVNGELYEVMRVGVPGASWVEVPAGDLIAYLRAALNEE